MKMKFLVLLGFVSTGLLSSARADLDVDVDIRLGRASPPPPPEVIVVDPVGPSAPPPWAKPRMFHRTYNYYYYPEANVYYRADNHTWFYLEGRGWRSARQLPPGLRVDFGRSVALRLDSDRPYIYHDRVVAYYPPGYFSRVRFKDGRDHDRHDGPDHDHGRGNDRDRRDDRRDDHRNDHDRDHDHDRR
jgi:hypothetical protein